MFLHEEITWGVNGFSLDAQANLDVPVSQGFCVSVLLSLSCLVIHFASSLSFLPRQWASRQVNLSGVLW